jgi:hypothetical protein
MILLQRCEQMTIARRRIPLTYVRRKMHKNLTDLLGDGPPIFPEKARPHLGKVVADFLSKYEWEVLSQAP